MATDLILDLRQRLEAIADPRRALAMQAYMKSAMPFHGVSTPARRVVTRALWRERTPADAATWRRQVARLWDGATHREERYAAIDWWRWAMAPDRAAARGRNAFHDPDALPLLRRLIVDGAWWDLVEDLAGHHLGVLLRARPAAMARTLRGWAAGRDLWLRRAAIIAQLDSRVATDTTLLADCIAPSLAPSPFAREFFIAKGIGWALRQHARHDPVWVLGYLRREAGRLPALSRREAAKHLAGR